MSLTAKEIDSVLNRSGDPGLAHRQWETFQNCFPKANLRQKNGPAFLSLFGNCRTFINWLVREPRLLGDILTGTLLDQPKNREHLIRDLQKRAPRNDLKTRLRRFRNGESLRIIMREISGNAPYEEIGAELSRLADVCLETALTHSLLETEKKYGLALSHSPGSQDRCEFAILGMGKLGGMDLNFSSDIDLLFVYTTDDGASERGLSLHEYATQLFKPVMETLQEKTEDGFVFRVDTNLRPEGKKGPLTNSLDAMENYYETWGTTWERSALIKARLSAGSQKIALDFSNRLKPFVYRHLLDTSALTDIRDMKQKINLEEKKRLFKTYNVKLGEGGIREVEFFVSVFQLLYGGKQTSLQQNHTLSALRELSRLGLIEAEVGQELHAAYVFLRRVENRLQIMDDQQVHHLPEDPHEMLALARRMGHGSVDHFMSVLQGHTRKVKDHFGGLVLK